VVLYGKARCFTEGMHDFDKLWGNCFDDDGLCAFDLLELDGEDYRAKPLAERKKRAARSTLADAFLDEAVLRSSGERLAILAHGCGFAALLDRARFGSSGKRLAILAERFGCARLRQRSAG
jgi:hypothetical protein